MLSMQHVQLRSAPQRCGPSRMRGSQTRRPFTCTRCQQQHDTVPDHNKTQRAMLDLGQKMAAIAAAALLMVEPASAKPRRLYSSSQKTETEFEEIMRSRGGFPQVMGSKKQDESSPIKDEMPQEFKLQMPARKSSQVQGANGRVDPDPVKAPPAEAEPSKPSGQPQKEPRVNIFSGESPAGGVQTARSPADKKDVKLESEDKAFAKEAAEGQEGGKGPSPPQTAPKLSDSTASTPNPVKAAIPLDPAAPVAKSAQDTQEVKKSPTPPPQETPAIQGLLEGAKGAVNEAQPEQVADQVEKPGNLAEDSLLKEAAPSGFAGFFENLKETFQPQQSMQSPLDQNPTEAASEAAKTVSESTPDSSSLAESTSDALKSVSEAAPESPAPEAPANGFNSFVDSVKERFKPEAATEAAKTVSNSVPDTAPDTDSVKGNASDALKSVSEAAPAPEAPASSLGNFVEGLKERFQPEAATEAAKTVSDSVPDTAPDSDSVKDTASDALQTVKEAAPESPAPEAPVSGFNSFVDVLKERFQPEAATEAAKTVSDSAADSVPDNAADVLKTVSRSAPDSDSVKNAAPDALKTVSEAAPDSPAPEAPASGLNNFVEGLKERFQPEAATEAAKTVGDSVPDSVPDNAADALKSIKETAPEIPAPEAPASGLNSFVEGLKERFQPEAATEAAKTVSDSVPDSAPDSDSVQATALDALKSVSDAAPAQEAPASSLSSFVEGLKERFQPEAATEAAKTVSDSVPESIPDADSAKKTASDALKTINEAAPDSPAPDAPVSGFNSFVYGLKEKFLPDNNPTEAGGEAAQSVAEFAPDASDLGGKAEEAVKSVSSSASDSATAVTDVPDSLKSVSAAVPDSSEAQDSASQAADSAANVVSESPAPDVTEDPKQGLLSVVDSLKEKLQPSEPEQSMLSNPAEAAGDAAQSLGTAAPAEAANDAVQSVSDSVPDSAAESASQAAGDSVQSVSDSAPDSAGVQDKAAEIADSSSQAAGSALRTVSDNAPDTEGAEATELAGKAADTVSRNVPESMGGKDKLEDVAPDSAPGRFEDFVDSLRSKLPGQSEPSAQSTAPGEGSNSNSSEADSLVTAVSDNISDSVGPITPDSISSPVNIGDATSAAVPSEAAISPQDSTSAGSNSVSDALTSVSDTVSSAADGVSEKAQEVVSPVGVTQVSASVADAGRDAIKDAANPANSGDAPLQAAPTASNAGDKALDQVQSVADPANVDQALDSVGDAVENAVPDPKDAPSGLAPTTAVSDNVPADKDSDVVRPPTWAACVQTAEGSVRDALSPGLAEVADTAQRKVQEAQPQLDPTQGIAAAKEAAAAAAASLLPVQPADAATLPGVQIKSSAGSGANNMGLVAEDVTAPAKEAATEAVKAAGPDTSKGLLISVGAVAVLAVVTFSLTGAPPTPKQAADAVAKVKDLNEFGSGSP